MITPSFSLTATERVLPKLALDFTTASLDPRVTFTRTTDATHPATYVNSSGYVTAATDNQPRFDYNPVTLACKGLLIEESRQNLVKYTEDFTQWDAALVTNISGTTPANGSTVSSFVKSTNNASDAILRSDSSVTNTVNYTQSVYAKKNGYQYLQIASSTGFSTFYCNFDLDAGTVTASSGIVSSQIQNAGNGWYRCIITATCSSTQAGGRMVLAIVPTSTSTRLPSWAGDGTSGVLIWGAQFEPGSFPTSYIPNTGATQYTRNADVATMTGTNFSDWWIATIGSANVSVIPKSVSGTKPLLQIDDNTTNNIISLRGNAANPELYIKATTDQVQIDAGTIVANTAYKLAGAWNTNNCAAAQNGDTVVTDTSATIPTVTQARIGSDGTNYANAWLQKINYWPQRITDNETQAFSK